MVQKVWYTYDDIHKTVRGLAGRIMAAGKRYDAMIAIGGGGFIPARMLRCFLNIPIYAVTTAYYLNESCADRQEEIQKIQWLDPIPDGIAGGRVLVVDEVDDSRVTMQFVLEELQKDGFADIGVAVLHNKIKDKQGRLPENMTYFAGAEVGDWWINYPWDADDIDAHNALAANGAAA